MEAIHYLCQFFMWQGSTDLLSKDIHSGFSGILGVSVAVSVPDHEFRDSYRGGPGSGALVISTPLLCNLSKKEGAIVFTLELP